jgi:hypothetical protein
LQSVGQPFKGLPLGDRQPFLKKQVLFTRKKS